MQCNDCGKPHLVAFRCGGRGFCPGCTGRRMAATAANLPEFVLPEAPLRRCSAEAVLGVVGGLRTHRDGPGGMACGALPVARWSGLECAL